MPAIDPEAADRLATAVLEAVVGFDVPPAAPPRLPPVQGVRVRPGGAGGATSADELEAHTAELERLKDRLAELAVPATVGG